MVQSLKILGQAYPEANTLTTLYTVPPSTSTAVSSLFVCNLESYTISFKVSLAVDGYADSPFQYIYNLDCDGNDTFVVTAGISLYWGDEVRIITNAVGLSFNLTGCENQ